ncbi:hypothetical protein [Kitasatospora sp. NBC_00315]|uniref:hypothetical protein n=1 Tax=Kitasatospora sp. NBC_00315 TaxID=2975963 RepID=UPI00324EC225
MRARIAVLMAATAGLALTVAAPASAAPTPLAPTLTPTPVTAPATPGAGCTAVANHPCSWHERGADGLIAGAEVSADPGQLTLLRVEVRTQRAWGSPWETVASASRVQYGSVSVAVPRLDLLGPVVICATGGPALRPELRSTTCTTPR